MNPTARPERRRETRYSFDEATSPVSAQWGAASRAAAVRSLSKHGVGLVLPHQPEPGTVGPLWIFNPARSCWHIKLAKVIYTLQRDAALWAIGCSFIQPLASHDLQDMVAQAAKM
jgi:hypothetical protein